MRWSLREKKTKKFRSRRAFKKDCAEDNYTEPWERKRIFLKGPNKLRKLFNRKY